MSVLGHSENDARAAGSLRTCIVTRQERPPEEMIRFVLDPEGRVTPDIRRRLPGRGVWIGASADLVARAVASRGFAKGFKAQAEVAGDLVEEVGRLLRQDALQSLSFANKAGLVIAGAAKVEAAIAQAFPAALIQAKDGGEDGVRKLRQAVLRRWGEASAQLIWIDMFESMELGLALGRTNVIHAALKKGLASGAFLERWIRLARYQGEWAPSSIEENSTRPAAS